jgi:hypothetical protein
MIIKNVPELIKILDYYKNPYILCHYRGIDWNTYERYSFEKKPNSFQLSDNLYIISCLKNQEYILNKNDFLYTLKGTIIINENKALHSDMYYYSYSNNICKGYNLYNSFFFYKN